MSLEATPLELVAYARDLLTRPAPRMTGAWPKATALLARQALEQAIDRLWEDKGLALAGCPARAQLLCLPAYVGDARLAARIAETWGELSDACHHHAYELAPSGAELGAWLTEVESLVVALGAGGP